MRIFIYLFILKLIAQTESTTNPKAVNVQLETVLEFNDKDKDADIKFIGNIQKVLKKVKTALSLETGRRSLRNKFNQNHIKFTDFILAAVDILLSYDDDDLVNIFSILDDEVRKYHYKGCKFYELVEDDNVRKFVARKLDELKKNKAKMLRKKLYKLVNIIENAKLIYTHKQFVDYINSLYRHESSKTFINILQNLENYRYKSKRSNMNLIEITRHGIRSVIFDYFSKLKPNVRRDIKKNIENTWSLNKNSKSKQTNENSENDFVNIIAEETKKGDKSESSSSVSNELDSDIKINILNAVKQKHAKIRHAIKKNISLLTVSPAKNIIERIGQEYAKKEPIFEPLWKEKTNKQKNDFVRPIQNTELISHSFETKGIKEGNKRNKRKKIKTKAENTKHFVDNVRKEKKRKENKHQKSKEKLQKADNVENAVIETGKKRYNIKSESSMKRPKTGSHENIFISFDNLDEKRHLDKDLETKAPHRKRKNLINRKQFKKRTEKLNVYSHSKEGMSIEYGNHRRIMANDKDAEIDKDKDNEQHKVSAEIIRKHFISRINNLEKQMEEMARKVDETTINDDFYDVDKKTTEKIAESSTETSNKDKLNITVKPNTSKRTTQSYHIIIGPENIPYNDDNISNSIARAEVKTNSFNITDNGKRNISEGQNTTVSEEAYLTDFDYSLAGIMKKLNINLTISEDKPEHNKTVIEKKLNGDLMKAKPDGELMETKSDGAKIEGKKTGMHRIELPI